MQVGLMDTGARAERRAPTATWGLTAMGEMAPMARKGLTDQMDVTERGGEMEETWISD